MTKPIKTMTNAELADAIDAGETRETRFVNRVFALALNMGECLDDILVRLERHPVVIRYTQAFARVGDMRIEATVHRGVALGSNVAAELRALPIDSTGKTDLDHRIAQADARDEATRAAKLESFEIGGQTFLQGSSARQWKTVIKGHGDKVITVTVSTAGSSGVKSNKRWSAWKFDGASYQDLVTISGGFRRFATREAAARAALNAWKN